MLKQKIKAEHALVVRWIPSQENLADPAIKIASQTIKGGTRGTGSSSLFKSKRLNANIKQTLLKALIRSVMTYACPAWEFVAESHLLKLQRLQNRVLRTIGKFPRRT
jgi:hypothetical protein